MTQRVFGAQFGVSRQQVQKWETGAALPHRRQLDKMVKLAQVTTTPVPDAAHADMLTVSAAAAHSSITEKTLRKAIKEGRLPYTVDTSPGPWPKSGRYLIRQADVDEFKLNRYDPYFKKGRWLRSGNHDAALLPVWRYPDCSRDHRGSHLPCGTVDPLKELPDQRDANLSHWPTMRHGVRRRQWRKRSTLPAGEQRLR
jgi:transcriptional regulator with XRE-family HTH domain